MELASEILRLNLLDPQGFRRHQPSGNSMQWHYNDLLPSSFLGTREHGRMLKSSHRRDLTDLCILVDFLSGGNCTASEISRHQQLHL
jgi:hypothetical protein